MSMEWFRWHHNTVSDPKLALIAKKAGQPRPVVIAVWAALLEQASQSDIRGDVSEFDVETIAVALDIEEDVINAVIAAMVTKGLIADQRIAKWEERQQQREDRSTERVRAFRERQKQTETACNAVKRTETHGNAQEEEERRVDVEERRKEEIQKREETAPAPFASPPTPIVAPIIATMATDTAKPKPKAPKSAKPHKAPMPADWTPAKTTYALLEKQSIDRPFAESCLDEFRLYWQERGESRPGWEATFVNNVKRQWEHHHTPATPTPRNGQRYTPLTHAMTPEVAEFDAILRNLNTQNIQPFIEGECHATH